MPATSDPRLIVGMERPDDAGVYKLRDDLALVVTLDFFTPIVDDPYTFGQITVANALSDIYAMGARPILAMNIICFPINKLDISILQETLRGGSDKMRQADVLLAGGHSVEDDEFKYGLSVTGTIHPNRVLTNSKAKVGDKLILTKPIGTGIISTAIKAKMADDISTQASIESMKTLNRRPAELTSKFNVHACTDVSGFGLLGHACEMIEDTDVGMTIYASNVPILPGTKEYAKQGLIPGGTYRNQQFRVHMINKNKEIPEDMMHVLFDAQTSGGLLIAIPEPDANRLLSAMHKEGIVDATIIGEITDETKGRIVVS